MGTERMAPSEEALMPTSDIPVTGIAGIAGLPLHQVGILVQDLEIAVARYSAFWGMKWQLWTYDDQNVPRLEYRGAPGHFQMRIALSLTEPQLELIQPTRGPSLYHEWTTEGRFGLHHVGIRVPDLSSACAALEGVGLVPLQAGAGHGLDGDGGFAYFDTLDWLGVYVELIEPPKRRREPESTYP